jgi:uncharacterized surface protein with fasciclin (FAS1) repeats
MMAWAANFRTSAVLGAVGGALLLAACSGQGGAADDAAAPQPSSETLAALVSQADDLSVVSATLKDAGLAQVFDGVAAYTLLAPQDSVFDGLGETGATLRSAEQRPAMVAVLRDHIVPGYLTPDDIAKAIELDDDGKVAMKTMAGHTLTFASAGDAITATGEDGATVRFAGKPLLASNGVAIPVDGLAVEVADGAAAQ